MLIEQGMKCISDLEKDKLVRSPEIDNKMFEGNSMFKILSFRQQRELYIGYKQLQYDRVHLQ